jgi:hypothetical protein
MTPPKRSTSSQTALAVPQWQAHRHELRLCLLLNCIDMHF